MYFYVSESEVLNPRTLTDQSEAQFTAANTGLDVSLFISTTGEFSPYKDRLCLTMSSRDGLHSPLRKKKKRVGGEKEVRMSGRGRTAVKDMAA